MTYGSERVLFKGRYGWVHTVALRSYTERILKARADYKAHPFERVKDNEFAELSKPFKPKPQRHWSHREIRYLKRKRAEGVEFTKIASHLGRSVGACQLKARQLGITNRRK